MLIIFAPFSFSYIMAMPTVRSVLVPGVWQGSESIKISGDLKSLFLGKAQQWEDSKYIRGLGGDNQDRWANMPSWDKKWFQQRVLKNGPIGSLGHPLMDPN